MSTSIASAEALSAEHDWRSPNERWTAQAVEHEFKNHELTIIRDDGVYRHLRCCRPDTWSYGFEIVTWPGHLAISGDIGCYVFSRVTDMFEFFGAGRINPGYWAEKALAVDRHGSPRQVTLESFEQRVRSWIASEAQSGLAPSDVVSFRCAVERDVINPMHDWGGGDLHEARRNLRDFVWVSPTTGERRDASDSWEWDFADYDTTFLRCCHAIVLAISKYREAHAQTAPA